MWRGQNILEIVVIINYTITIAKPAINNITTLNVQIEIIK